jgi:hypothetical protein
MNLRRYRVKNCEQACISATTKPECSQQTDQAEQGKKYPGVLEFHDCGGDLYLKAGV